MSYDKKFSQLSFREQLINRAYRGGSNKVSEKELWVLEKDKFTKQTRKFSNALVNNIDEIIVNACDHAIRYPQEVSKIEVSWDPESGELSCLNDGPGIPVISEWDGKPEGETDTWLPEAVIARDSVGSNFKDKLEPDRVTGGLNGLGTKVVTAGSKSMCVETVDSERGKYYKQLVEDRMGKIHKPEIKSRKSKSWTKFTWIPCYDELCKDDEPNWISFSENKSTIQAILELRLYQISIFLNSMKYRYDASTRIERTRPISIIFNKKKIVVKNMGEYMSMFGISDYVVLNWSASDSEVASSSYPIRFPWVVGLGLASQLNSQDKISKSGKNLENMSIVNGVHVSMGGSHINLMTRAIIAHLSEKLNINENVFSTVFCWFDVIFIPFSHFQYENQTKDKVNIGVKSQNIMKKTYSLTTKHMNALDKITSLAKKQITWMMEEKEFHEQVKKVKKAINGRERKHEKAEFMNHKNKDCYLVIPEGDSAEGTVRNILMHKKTPIDKRYYGIFNIQGVPPNALKMVDIITNPHTGKKIVKPDPRLLRNASIIGLISAIGLDLECTYEQNSKGDSEYKALKYKYLIMATDQDVDGIGFICTLVLVFIWTFWPDLIKRGFFKRFATPIVRIFTPNKKVYNFYSEKESDDWIKEHWNNEIPRNAHIKYYKGLGGHNEKEILDMCLNFNKNILTITWNNACNEIINIMFGRETRERKKMLKKMEILEYPSETWSKMQVDIKDHLLIEAKNFQLYSMRRKLKSAVDGFIPTQRKALCGARMLFANNNKEQKIFEIASYVVNKMHYAHGPTSLENTIIYMAQKQEVNLPAFIPSGSFCTKDKGREAHSAPRYISAKYNAQLMNLVYPRIDDPLLPRVYEEGYRCEPEYYVPVIPMSILEHETTPGTGWKIDVWARDFSLVLKNIRILIKNDSENKSDDLHDLFGHVWLRSYRDNEKPLCKIRTFEEKEICYGNYQYNPKENTIIVNELPPRVWSYNFKCNLMGLDPRTQRREKENAEGELVEIPKKPYIKDIYDSTGNYIVDLKIKLEPGAYEKIQKEYGKGPSNPIEHFLELRRPLTKALNMLDIYGNVHEFQSYNGVIKYWYVLRKKFYSLRIKRQKLIMKTEIKILENKLKFIIADSRKTINIDADYTDEQVDKILHDFGIIPVNITKFNDLNELDTADIVQEIFKNNTNYDYIRDIKIREKSQANIIKLKTKLDAKKSELSEFEKKKWSDIWLEELDKIENLVEIGHKKGWEPKKDNLEFTSIH